jgi:hypothetical protein
MIEELDVLSAGYPGNLEVLHKGPKRSLLQILKFFLVTQSVNFLSPKILALTPTQSHRTIWIHIRFGFSTGRY